MTFPVYGPWSWLGFTLLLVALVFVGGRTLSRLGVDVPGMRFPVRPRLNGVSPGWRARLAHLPTYLRFAALILLFVALLRPQLAQTETADVEGIDTPVNPKLLEDIAVTTGASFYRATDPESLTRDFQDLLDGLEKSRLVDHAAAERTEVFHLFALPALFLLLLEIALSQTILRRFP